MRACFPKFLAVLFSTALLVAGEARAAGFYIQEQSVRSQGASFAGAAANPQDASTIFYNPAGMTELEGREAAAGVSLILPRVRFSNRGSTGGLTAGAQGAYGGGDNGNPLMPKPIPGFYGVTPVAGGKYWLGLGVSVPYGLSNKYDRTWFGRYDSTQSKIAVVDFAPVLAVKLNDRFSIGGGPNFQHAEVRLDSALPCPSVGAGCAAAFAPATDGLSRLAGDSFGTGYNLSGLWRANEKTRVGLHYRSAVTHNFKGLASVSGLTGALAAFNRTQDASAKLTTPAIASLGVAYDATDRLKILNSLTWTQWSNFKEIRVRFLTGGADSVSPQNYRDVWSAALGAEWKHTGRLSFRGGVQYDRTPTTNTDRSTRIPDSDRRWVSGGASYAVSDALTLDAAASHIFMENASIGLVKPFYTGTAADTTVRVNGVTRGSADILSLQARVRF